MQGAKKDLNGSGAVLIETSEGSSSGEKRTNTAQSQCLYGVLK